MYYSYKCTYFGRVYYVYESSRERASHVLYNSIKQHLIDYKEDEKEYELDDGEQIESNEIYDHMVESNDRPSGGYEATVTDSVLDNTQTSSTAQSSYSSSSASLIFLFILIIGGIICLFLFFPEIISTLQSFIQF